MIGLELAPGQRDGATPGDVLVRAEELSLHRSGRAGAPAAIVGASFAIRAGEIVGIAAIDGNGQHELLRAIAGVDNIARIGGTLHVTAPASFIPEDRTTEGLIPSFTLAENFLLGTQALAGRWLDWPAIRDRTAELILAHEVRATGPDTRAGTLSGGNQQKFILARALEGAPRVIVAEDPTRGLDLLGTESIHARLRSAARAGAAVIVHASDLDEVLGLADRLLVVARGRVRELPRDTPRDVVGDAMLALDAAA